LRGQFYQQTGRKVPVQTGRRGRVLTDETPVSHLRRATESGSRLRKEELKVENVSSSDPKLSRPEHNLRKETKVPPVGECWGDFFDGSKGRWNHLVVKSLPMVVHGWTKG